MKELRKHPRFECEGVAEIHLLGIEKSCPARIEDLSLKGCKLVLHEPDLDLPKFFELTFMVNELSFRVRCRLAGFRAAGGVGVEFVDLRPRSKRYILDLLEELATGAWKPRLQGAAFHQHGAKGFPAG